MRILLVEDNRRLSASLIRALGDHGYAVDAAFDGIDGTDMGTLPVFDLIILDIMLPGRDGFDVCRSLRDVKVSTPILMLTARTDLDDRVRGLDAGADDYLQKPFELAELLARVRALLRRGATGSAGTLQTADLFLDPARHEVLRAGKPVNLSPREYELLEYLLRHAGQTMTRGQIEDHLWNNESTIASNAVNVHVRRLRSKIDDSFEPKLLETVRGAGYRIRDLKAAVV